MAFTVNDRRSSAAPEKTLADPLEKLATADPERTYQVVVGAMKAYLKSKMVYKTDAEGKRWTDGLAIPDPNADVVTEFGRYIVQAILKSADPRSWILSRVDAMQVGDVFTRYRIVKGKQIDEEVTLVSRTAIKAGAIAPMFCLRVRTSGAYDTFDAAGNYLFYVHRPSMADLAQSLDEDDES